MGSSQFSPVRRIIFLLGAAFAALGASLQPLWGQPTLISQAIPAATVTVGAGAQVVTLTNYIQNPNAAGTVVRIAVGTLNANASTISPSNMTLLGNIDIALTDNLTPQTVANFLAYINAGSFVDNIIHRSMPGFVIQGGGFNFSVVNGSAQAGLVPTIAPIPFEQGLSNVAGTIAMAQSGGDQNSATSQWFINLVDNSSNLDSQNGGFCAFGTVLGNGMAVANAVAAFTAPDLTSFAGSLSNNITVEENIAGAWTNVPLANFTGSLFLTNFVFTNISQIPALTFTATSANTSLITANVSGNSLTLTPVDNATGSTNITVTATDTEGAQFQTTFTVNVTNPALATIIAVAAGGDFTLFLKSDGSLWAMGQGSSGQLGDGLTAVQDFPLEIVASGVTAIAAGSDFSLFVKNDGSLWAMGFNGNGELGDGTTSNSLNPEQIVASGVIAIAAGGDHGLFLKSDGSLWAMGANSSGQLGDGTMTNQSSPEEIESSGVTTISAGGAFSMFLKSDGSLWVMGNNSTGQLGDGTSTNSLAPEEIESSGVTAIAAGTGHSLFLESDGSLWGMGFNNGDLGTGTSNLQLTPEKIETSGVNAIAAGNQFSLYIGSGGSLWAMGDNSFGQLGDGTTNGELVPQEIQTSGVMAISAGGSFSLFLKSDNSLWAMGNNSFGQLGDGTVAGELSPEQIYPFTLLTFTTQPASSIVAAGQTATFTVAAGGDVASTYQWQISTSHGATWSNLTNGGNYSGSTTATLTVTDATVAMSGEEFQCVASNLAGSATSSPATLTVKPAATVTLSSLTQTYTGTARTVSVSTNPSGLAFNVTYNGSTTAPTIPGNYAVVVTVTDANHIGSASGTLIINKATASVSLSNTSQAYNGSPKTVTVTTNPGNLTVNVTYNGSTTPPVNGGSYAVVATATDANHLGTATGTLTITKAAQTITFGGLAGETFGNGPVGLTATASSGLPVTYASSNTSVATITGNILNIIGKGTATITASQPGNSNFNAASNVGQTLTVNQVPAFTTQPATKTTTAGQTASFTVAANGLPTPVYQWQREAAGTSTFVNLANGGSYAGVTTATLSVSNTTVAMAGDQFQCVATNAAGSATSNPASLEVSKASATVTLSNLTQTYTGTARTVTVSTNPSGLAFNLTYNGSATAPIIPGNYAVTATITDVNHAGSANGTLVINKSTASVSISNTSQTYNGSPKSVTVTTNPSGLAVNVTYNGSTPPPTNGGSYAVAVTVTDPFSSGSGTGTLTINKAAQTITFGPLAGEIFGNAPFALTATASSGLAVTYTSSSTSVATVNNGTVTLVGKGTATITASQSGNSSYNAASNVTQVLTVNQVPVFTSQPTNKTSVAGQTASIPAAATGLPTPTYQWQREAFGTSTFVNLANSGSYSGVTTATLSISNTTVAMSGDQFQCVATNSAGNATSNPATLTVNKAPATVTLSNLTQTYTGTARTVTASTSPSGLAFNLTYNGSATAPVIPGNYAVVATITDANHTGSANGTLVINKSTASISISNTSQTYNGSPKSVTVTTNPVGLSFNVTYNGSATPPTNGGSYAVVATITDPFSSGNATGTLTINKAAQTITFGSLPVQKTGNAPFALTAAASSGLSVTYASSNTAVATISGNTVTMVGKGTATITASQSGNSSYNAASNVAQALTVNQVPAFTSQPANKTATAGQTASFTVAATGLPTPTYQWQREAFGTSTFVNLANGGGYSGVTTTTLSVSGTTVAMSGDQFQCVATNVAGSTTSNPATLTVTKASATVTLSNLTQTYTGTARTVTVATNPGGLTYNLTYNGSITAPIGAGNYTVSATITDANHAGGASGNLVINKATATVTLTNLSQTYDGTPKSVGFTTNPANLTVNVTYNGSATPPTNAGSYSVVATVVDGNYTGTGKGTLTIGKAAQIIAFGELDSVTVGDSPFGLTATASSGLAVTYSSSNTAVATVNNGTVTIGSKAGAVNITAMQPGNANYNAAVNVSHVLTVNAASTTDSDSSIGFDSTITGNREDGTVVSATPPSIISSIINDADTVAWVSSVDLSSTDSEPEPAAADLPGVLLDAMNLNVNSSAALLPSASVQLEPDPVKPALFLTLQYRQSKDPRTAWLMAQYSTDEVNWTAVPTSGITQLADDDADTERWSVSMAVPTGARLYLRLIASPSP